MKCIKCGAELEESAVFCRECGTKIQYNREKRFCSKCGARLNGNEKFCTNCGAEINFNNAEPSENVSYEKPKNNEKATAESQEKVYEKTHDKVLDEIEQKSLDWCNGLSGFGKVSVIAAAVFALLFITAVFAGKIAAVIIGILQLALVVAAVLVHKRKIELGKKEPWIKWLLLGAAIGFTVLNIASYSWSSAGKDGKPDNSAAENAAVDANVSMPFDAKQCLGQSYTDVKDALDSAGFKNIEVERIEDLKLADADRLNAVDSVSVDGENNFDKDQKLKPDAKILIRYHAYAKCKLKLHVEFIPNLLFSKYNVKLLMNGNEVGRLNHGENKDFEIDTDPGEYTLTFESAESSSVKGETGFTLDCDVDTSLRISCSSDRISVETLYVDRLEELDEGQVKVNTSESEYSLKNYKEVADSLEKSGFTNIKYEILYDIVFGVTDSGAVERVSIAGQTDFRRGDVFPENVEVIITYHMPTADDPNRPAENTAAEKEENEPAVEETIAPAPNLTIDNCPELAAMLSNKAEIDASYSAFSSKYRGNLIEFDGRIDYCAKHENYKTRYDYLVSAGDYDPNHQVGPSFKFENVNIFDLNTDLDSVRVGMNVRIVAQVGAFDSGSGLFYLKPVSVMKR